MTSSAGPSRARGLLGRRRALLFAGLISLGIALFALLWIFSGRGAECGPATSLWITRHADRDGRTDALGAEGWARARALAHALEKADIGAIYASDTRRAEDTAVPLASARGLTPNVYAARDGFDWVQKLLDQHRGTNVLVVGHSNTVPRIIAAAGGPSLPDLAEDELDRLFLLSVSCPPEPARLFQLQYGAPSPPTVASTSPPAGPTEPPRPPIIH
jgi:phosphohistidine phosphatase SixA